MIYGKGEIKNGEFVITEEKEINQSKLTSDCWLIQFNGIKACDTCNFLNTYNYGGKNIRKKLLKV